MQRFESKNLFGFSATEFESWLFGPENFPGLSRNGPLGTDFPSVALAAAKKRFICPKRIHSPSKVVRYSSLLSEITSFALLI